MAPGTRLALQIVGLVVLIAGLVLFGLAIATMAGFANAMDEFSGSGDVGSMGGRMARAAIFGFSGVFTIAIGAMLTSLGFRKPMSELAATDTSIAVEHSSTAMGRGLARGLHEAGGLSRGRDIVKVKCRACGFLESEDAKFCSQCSKKM